MPIEAILLIIFVALSLIMLVVSFCVAHFCLPEIENNLKDCEFLKVLKVYDSLGLMGKGVKCSVICFIFLIPHICIKKGLVTQDAIKRFPLGLKLTLLVPWCSMFLLLLAILCIEAVRV